MSRSLEDGTMEEQIGSHKADAVVGATFKVCDGLLKERNILRAGSLGRLGGEGGLNHEAHLGKFLKRGVVEEKEELHGDSEDGGRVLVEVAAVSHLLGDDAHDFQNL